MRNIISVGFQINESYLTTLMIYALIISLNMNFNYPQANITVNILLHDLVSVAVIYRLCLVSLQYAGLEVELGKSSGAKGLSQN